MHVSREHRRRSYPVSKRAVLRSFADIPLTRDAAKGEPHEAPSTRAASVHFPLSALDDSGLERVRPASRASRKSYCSGLGTAGRTKVPVGTRGW
jgi:hypothetical protein